MFTFSKSVKYRKISKDVLRIFVKLKSFKARTIKAELVAFLAKDDIWSFVTNLNHINNPKMSLVMRKPAFCICENKDADQLRGYREADQRLCFFLHG